jgi:hypothetical protein
MAWVVGFKGWSVFKTLFSRRAFFFGSAFYRQVRSSTRSIKSFRVMDGEPKKATQPELPVRRFR